MSEPRAEKPKDEADDQVRCRRTGEKYSPDEHHRCPYCYGAIADVAEGDHETFCDFDPEKDPVQFGFPENGTRHQTG